MGIQIGCYVVGLYQTNVYYLWREGSADCIVVDPAALGDRLYEALDRQGLHVSAILLTHGHSDHIMGVKELKARSGAVVLAPQAEKRMLSDAEMNGSMDFGGRGCTVNPDRWLSDGDIITEAGITLRMIETPGHTEGSCCYYCEEGSFLLSGDTLFEDSVGRTDMPTGSSLRLLASIREKLYILPEETAVYPGHGGATDIGHEKRFNFFTS